MNKTATILKTICCLLAFACSLYIAACESSNQPIKMDNDDYAMFVEEEMYIKLESNVNELRLDKRTQLGYEYNAINRTIKVDTIRNQSNYRINPSHIFMEGKKYIAEDIHGKGEIFDLMGYASGGNGNKWIGTTDEEFYFGGDWSYYPIDEDFVFVTKKNIDLSGNITILVNNREITLRQNETFCDSIIYNRNIELWGTPVYYNLKQVYTIKNNGFIKKSDITYK